VVGTVDVMKMPMLELVNTLMDCILNMELLLKLLKLESQHRKERCKGSQLETEWWCFVDSYELKTCRQPSQQELYV